MGSRCFPLELKQRASSHNDLSFKGFPLYSSSSNGFCFSDDRTVIVNHKNTEDSFVGLSQNLSQMGFSHRNLSLQNLSSSSNGFCFSDDRTTILNHKNTNDSLVGLPQNLSQMGFSDTRTTSIFTGSRRNLYGCSKLDQDLSLKDLSSRFQGLVQSSHGRQVSMSGYVDDGHYNKVLLGLQDFPEPKSRAFTEIMSRHNRDFLLSAMEGSRELKDLPLDLASIVEIYGSVCLMAKDQAGCRFLQKVLEKGSSLDVKVLFGQVINHVVELGIDPFGNFFIQKLFQVCNEEQRTQILIMFTSKPGLLLQISLNSFGTRVVQKLIETVSTKEQISLVKSALKPGFLTLINNANGNHVIQCCLQYLGPNDNKFVLEEATRFCTLIATHKTGCSVLQDCVFYSVGVERVKLVAEISKNSLHLAQDPFGNYVVQFIIDQKLGGTDVMFELRGNYAKLSTQKFSSHVVEKCLRHYPESRDQIVRELVSVPNFERLLGDPYANYVIQSALSVSKGVVRERLVKKVRKFGNLSTSPYCKKMFSKNKSLLKK